MSRAFGLKGPGDDLLSHGQSAISSARRRFTVLFGMGRGGANALWSPGILEWKVATELCIAVVAKHRQESNIGSQPHYCKVIESSRTGELVPVSSTHYCAYTPGLSTWWSTTT